MKILRQLIIPILGFCVCAENVRLDAQTPVGGVIAGKTWRQAESPYTVMADILVASLTIEPGVEVLFEGNYAFEVAGILKAVGTSDRVIRFARSRENTVGWHGIYFNESVPGSELVDCMVEGAVNSGIRIVNAVPRIERCVLRGNSTPENGGGISVVLNKEPALDELLLLDCMISRNTSGSHGGGIYIRADTGSVKLLRCQIFKNQTNPAASAGNFVGGGMYSNGVVTMLHCSVSGNTCYARQFANNATVTARGGGICHNGTFTMSNCVLRENRIDAYAPHGGGGEPAYAYGGGFYLNSGSLIAKNCVWIENMAVAVAPGDITGVHGAGVYMNSDGEVHIENNTFTLNNSTAIRRANGTVSVVNSIFWDNNSKGTQLSGPMTVTYSTVQNGFDGEGNIETNPIFYDQQNPVVIPPSLAINAGNPDPAYSDVCFGPDAELLSFFSVPQALFLDPSVDPVRNDMGAHGGPGACEWTFLPPVIDPVPLGHYEITEGVPWEIDLGVQDFNVPALDLEFRLSPASEGAMIVDGDDGSRKLLWTPSETAGGSDFPFTVEVEGVNVSNPETPLLDRVSFVLSVTETNSVPIFERFVEGDLNHLPGPDPLPLEVDEGALLILRAIASDPDIPRQDLTFSLEEAPVGMAIDPVQGVLTWIPTEEQGPGVYSFQLCVTDDSIPAPGIVCQTVMITVNEINCPPEIDLIQDVVMEPGDDLCFELMAFDKDLPSHELTFSLDACSPEFASIDPVTGELCLHPPQEVDQTTYEICVRVTDNGDPAMSAELRFSVSLGDCGSTMPEGLILPPPVVQADGSLQFQLPVTVCGNYTLVGTDELAMTYETGNKSAATFVNPVDLMTLKKLDSAQEMLSFDYQPDSRELRFFRIRWENGN